MCRSKDEVAVLIDGWIGAVGQLFGRDVTRSVRISRRRRRALGRTSGAGDGETCANNPSEQVMALTNKKPQTSRRMKTCLSERERT